MQWRLRPAIILEWLDLGADAALQRTGGFAVCGISVPGGQIGLTRQDVVWFLLSEDALVQEVDDDLVILNLATEQYHALNSTARRFFELCRSSGSREEAVSRIAAEFGIDLVIAAQDLDALLAGLEQRGVLRSGQ